MTSRRFLIVVVAIAASTVLGTSGALAREPTWRIQASATPTGRNAYLTSVACPSTSSCFAAGVSLDDSDNFRRLMERWHAGTWTIQNTQGPSASSSFHDVSCVGASSCVAVGSGESGPLIDRWNGAVWASEPVSTTGALLGVTCVSASSCVAVGYRGSPDYSALIEHWNGHTWTTQTAPNSGTPDSILSSVSCVSASNCTAVGNNNDGDEGDAPLIDHWNGTRWSLMTAAHLDRFTSLLSIDCTAASSCWAAGFSYLMNETDDLVDYRRLLEHWNGHTWSIVTTPAPSGEETEFFHVTCSHGQCIAVGSSHSDPRFGTVPEPLVDRWNGHTWMTETVTTPPSGYGEFVGAACVTATTCVAVGDAPPGGSPAPVTTLIERAG